MPWAGKERQENRLLLYGQAQQQVLQNKDPEEDREPLLVG